jgi:hypothetical protein
VYFWLADRFCEGPGLLELAVAAASSDSASLASRIEMLLALSYAGPEARDARRAEGTVAFGIAISGDDEHAATLADEAQVRLEELENHWAARVRTRLSDRPDAEGLETAEAIAHGPFQVAGLLIEAWTAERRDEFATAAQDYRQALDIARQATAAQGPSPAASKAARALWSSANARAELAGAGHALGRSESARALYRRVVDWSTEPRPEQPRETFLAALVGTPAAAALSTTAEAPS